MPAQLVALGAPLLPAHDLVFQETALLPRMPSFFKFLIVLSYYIFIEEKVDVVIMEVGMGGRYDCSNIVT